MKICLFVWVSQLLSTKKTLIQKLNNFIIPDPKHKMFETFSVNTILKSVKETGVDGLELIIPPIFTDEDFKNIKKIADDHNLKVFSIHQSDDSAFNIEFPEIERLSLIANKLQTNIVTLHVDSLKERIFDDKFIGELKNLQKKYKVKFGIENMPKSIFTLGKSYTYKGDEFSSVVDKTGLSITLDTTHMGQVNEDICDFFTKNKDKIIDIHLSDYKTTWLNRKLLLANDTHLPLGKGELPITKFLKTLKEENYEGVITMEINGDLETLCQNAELIKNALK
ncbi:MAG: sugar phosphate isomerase/epimerase family protein [Candidatus Gracilibacteria bacterium]|jgi:sugar phosphate isomerase/epimerase